MTLDVHNETGTMTPRPTADYSKHTHSLSRRSILPHSPSASSSSDALPLAIWAWRRPTHTTHTTGQARVHGLPVVRGWLSESKLLVSHGTVSLQRCL
jgi:hypothetical protein